MTHIIPAGSPKAASAAAFGRELLRAMTTRSVPRNELWRSTGIGRTALDNYRTGSSLPRTETAAVLASVLDWPKLIEIARAARTKACRRCSRAFTMESGNLGAKRYCSTACREAQAQDTIAATRTRQAGQTDDNRRRYQALARLRSGIRIAEEQTAALRDAIDRMCGDCEPVGLCRTPECQLRPFSPLPIAVHRSGDPRTAFQVRRDSFTPARRAAQSERTRQMHVDGVIPRSGRNLPANDPARREAWIQSIRDGKARKRAAG